MRKYRVTAALSYDVEAEDQNDAIDKAESLLAQELEDLHCGVTEIFGFDAERIE